MQLKLIFKEQPDAPAIHWEALDETQRAEVVEKLARLIAKAAFPDAQEEETEDDRYDKD